MRHYIRTSYWKNLFQRTYMDLEGYSKERFFKDLAAGIVTGIVAIPLSLALAIATGVPPVYGLYTAAVAGVVASFLGGSRFSISGPAAAMVPILAGIIHEYGLPALPTIGFLAGIILIIMGVSKLGRLVVYVPAPVVLGFTAGIAITLFWGQMPAFLGVSGLEHTEHFHERVWQIILHLNTVNPLTLAIGFLTLATLIYLPKVKMFSKIPASLIAVIVTTLLVAFVPAFSSVKTIQDAYGAIPAGFHMTFPLMPLSFWPDYAAPALQIAFLITIESLLCALMADKLTRTKHNSNVELVAQGVANLFSPFFSGIPATAVIARTGTSIKSGATSRIAGIIHGLIVFTFILLLAREGGMIPLATLAAILFVTAWKISEFKEISRLIRIAPKGDLSVLALTLTLTVFVDLTVAVGFGMVLAILAFFKDASTLYIEFVTPKSDHVPLKVRNTLQKHKEIEYINLDGNLSIGSASLILDRIHPHKGCKEVVIRMREVHQIDLSGLEALHELITELHNHHIQVALTSINPRVSEKLRRYGILDEAEHVYVKTEEFLRDVH
jgi:sulfate permease, SulP family